MMTDEDQRQNERRALFIKYVTKIMVANSTQEVRVLDEDGTKPWRIRIEISSPRKTAIILEPSRPLMTDRENNFQNIIERGITEAYRILSDPKEDKILQGTLHLDNDYKMTFVKFTGFE